ncbi:MAG TPA: hypothetical protein PKD54_11415 [Pirellulaceae bacterium]|nr:hypothetical protein [Pirellulaceae bacterium]
MFHSQFFTNLWSRWKWAPLFAVAVLTVGCLKGGQFYVAAEHDIPENMPPDFPTAVERLNELVSSGLVLGSSTALAHETANEIMPAASERLSSAQWEELIDLVGWLSELAIDSDLEEPHWQKVHVTAEQMSEWCQETQRLGPPTATHWANDRQRWVDWLATLAEVVAEYERLHTEQTADADGDAVDNAQMSFAE